MSEGLYDYARERFEAEQGDPRRYVWIYGNAYDEDDVPREDEL